MKPECLASVQIPDAQNFSPSVARSLVEHVNEMVTIFDGASRIIYVNPASRAVLGYEASALVGLEARSLVHPEDRHSVEEALMAAWAQPGNPVTVCCRLRHAVSGYRMLETRGSLDLDLPGGPGIVLVSRDITHQHRQSRLQECWGRTLLDDHPRVDKMLAQVCATLVECFDLELAFAAQSEAGNQFRTIAHAGRATGILKRMLSCNLHGGMRVVMPCLEKSVRSGLPQHCGALAGSSCCWLTATDTPGARTVFVIPVKTGKRVVAILTLVSADVDAFDLQAQALLREFAVLTGLVMERLSHIARLDLLGSALSAAANAIFITDRHATIEWVNDAFTELSGYTREELVGKTPRLLRSGLQDQEYYLDLKKMILAGRSWRGEITNRRKDGSLYTAHQTITPIVEDGCQVRHFIAIQQDMTERKRMEREICELTTAIKMVRQDVRGQIAREIHDELGGSLVSLRHDIEWLLKHAEGTMRERLEIMHELTLHSLAAARQIVAGLRPPVVDDLGLVDAISWLVREFMQHHELDITVDVGRALSQLPPEQAAETYRVIQECLTNVAKHAQASHVRIHGRVHDHLLVLEVVDDGIGTEPDSAARGSRGMTERARLMGGYLEIGPAKDGGTLVRLIVPVHDNEGRT